MHEEKEDFQFWTISNQKGGQVCPRKDYQTYQLYHPKKTLFHQLKMS